MYGRPLASVSLFFLRCLTSVPSQSPPSVWPTILHSRCLSVGSPLELSECSTHTPPPCWQSISESEFYLATRNG